MKAVNHIIILLAAVLFGLLPLKVCAQVNTDQVIRIGQNALYFDDYVLSIQYFNQAIQAKPYLAQPYFFRAIAKLNLEDYRGAEADASEALRLNPFLSDAWEVRGVARQNLGKDSLAILDYDHALELLPRNRQIMFNKAMALVDMKRLDDAHNTFDEVLKYYPGFSNAYLGRARVSLAQADTTAAMADIDKALSINKDAVNAYIMRADIAINSESDYQRALDDIDHAIKLLPRQAGLYINRAFLRYKLDNYSGAMADYDYALSLEPYNLAALFNRGMLLAEVNANDLALEDFNRVLELDPDNYQALYNRALIHKAKGNTNAAVADIDRVAERFPDFPGAYYLRGSIWQDAGNLAKAERDYKQAQSLSKALPAAGSPEEAAAEQIAADIQAAEAKKSESSDAVARRFASLMTVNDNADFREEYNNSAIRGRVQDRNQNVEIEPMMLVSFYSSPTELRDYTYYIKEVDELNATRVLRFLLVVTNAVPQLDEATIGRHFSSIDYYNSYLATHNPRPVDYLGRAMDFITVRDYINAEKDLDRAIAMAPNLTLAYLLRSQARYGRYLLEKDSKAHDAITRLSLNQKLLDDIIADLDRVSELSPEMAVVYFNKGNVLLESGKFTDAIEAYSKAIEIKPDFGEAYYNRGYTELRAGHRERGIADLSKAGESGIAGAYNLMKRMIQ
ncbi:MAG: tetratricopeptide repeat protein [Bacteroidales bacterium]|nr:tetratricopeptide repeat protein [Bacteroidales bacterium]